MKQFLATELLQEIFSQLKSVKTNIIIMEDGFLSDY